jgi:hypothetical protein
VISEDFVVGQDIWRRYLRLSLKTEAGICIIYFVTLEGYRGFGISHPFSFSDFRAILGSYYHGEWG